MDVIRATARNGQLVAERIVPMRGIKSHSSLCHYIIKGIPRKIGKILPIHMNFIKKGLTFVKKYAIMKQRPIHNVKENHHVSNLYSHD